jgi:hypothetical protein
LQEVELSKSIDTAIESNKEYGWCYTGVVTSVPPFSNVGINFIFRILVTQ